MVHSTAVSKSLGLTRWDLLLTNLSKNIFILITLVFSSLKLSGLGVFFEGRLFVINLVCLLEVDLLDFLPFFVYILIECILRNLSYLSVLLNLLV